MKVVYCEMGDVRLEDFPAFENACVVYAEVVDNGVRRECTDEELLELNMDADFVYNQAIDCLF